MAPTTQSDLGRSFLPTPFDDGSSPADSSPFVAPRTDAPRDDAQATPAVTLTEEEASRYGFFAPLPC